MSMPYPAESYVSGLPATSSQGAAMDKMYRFQRHIYDASRAYYLLGRDQLIRELNLSGAGKVLEMGSGTGRNLAAVAHFYPQARLYGIDISQEMLKSALDAFEKRGLARSIRLACVDATGFDALAALGENRFDRIFFSYTLSMIPDWQQAVQQALHLLSEQGELHIVDFGQSEAMPAPFRHALFAWLRRFHVVPRADLRQVLLELAKANHCNMQFTSCYRGYAWRAKLRKA